MICRRTCIGKYSPLSASVVWRKNMKSGREMGRGERYVEENEEKRYY
jgi:hypothetical protein